MKPRLPLTLLTEAVFVGCLGMTLFAGAGEIPPENQQAIERELARIDQGIAAGPYKADMEDLARHNAAPEWFLDAKFGIYFHWGVYSVPAYGNEWYPKWMHTKTGRRSYYQHHVETYGEPDKFGYHDFVPMFKAEHFDADDWAELFKQAGAQYAGPVCEHHDSYSMWDSDITPWNAADTGPKRDITGELEKAIKARGMKFVTTFHHERSRVWMPRPEDEPTWPVHSTDPKLRMIYANVSEGLFNQIFLTKLGEVIDKYEPDLIWFDGQMQYIPMPIHEKFLAYYFNCAKRWGKDVVVTTKKRQYPEEISVMDYEKGRATGLTDFPWLTDDTISMGSWCYTQDLEIKDSPRVLHDLIDTVSKNGCMLLNISPKADGTIPKKQRNVLLDIGRWLKVNGEAIYKTRPWLIHGEGPTKMAKGGSFNGHQTHTAADIRYTRAKDDSAVYVIPLGWNAKPFTCKSIKVEEAAGGAIRLLGSEAAVKFSVSDAGQLVITPPALAENQRPCKDAYAFKLTGFKLSLQSETQP